MRRTTLLNLHKFKLTDIFAGNKVLILTIFFFLTGVFISVVLRGNNQTVSALGGRLYEIYRQQHFELEFLSVFSNTVIFNLLILCICFTAGTSMFGVLLSPLICFFYGGIFGSLASYMCVTYLLKGIAFNAVVLIPGYIISAIVLLFASREAILFSYSVSGLTFNNGIHNDLPYKFKGYCIKFLIMAVFNILSAILDGVFSSSLIKIFEF